MISNNNNDDDVNAKLCDVYNKNQTACVLSYQLHCKGEKRPETHFLTVLESRNLKSGWH